MVIPAMWLAYTYNSNNAFYFTTFLFNSLMVNDNCKKTNHRTEKQIFHEKRHKQKYR